MALARYHHYSTPRLSISEGRAYLIRDVLTESGRFSGVCEYASYFDSDGDLQWKQCREGVEFSEIAPFAVDLWCA